MACKLASITMASPSAIVDVADNTGSALRVPVASPESKQNVLAGIVTSATRQPAGTHPCTKRMLDYCLQTRRPEGTACCTAGFCKTAVPSGELEGARCLIASEFPLPAPMAEREALELLTTTTHLGLKAQALDG